jgi:hypothetical protein
MNTLYDIKTDGYTPLQICPNLQNVQQEQTMVFGDYDVSQYVHQWCVCRGTVDNEKVLGQGLCPILL